MQKVKSEPGRAMDDLFPSFKLPSPLIGKTVFPITLQQYSIIGMIQLQLFISYFPFSTWNILLLLMPLFFAHFYVGRYFYFIRLLNHKDSLPDLMEKTEQPEILNFELRALSLLDSGLAFFFFFKGEQVCSKVGKNADGHLVAQEHMVTRTTSGTQTCILVFLSKERGYLFYFPCT